jgi:hypothetical protein
LEEKTEGENYMTINFAIDSPSKTLLKVKVKQSRCRPGVAQRVPGS